MKFLAYLVISVVAGGLAFGDSADAAFMNSGNVNLRANTAGFIAIGDPEFFDVDFRDQLIWGAGHGSQSITRPVDGNNLDLMSMLPTVDATVSAFRGNGTDLLYRDTNDGFGILSGENDEIDGVEFMIINFAETVALEGVFLTDLFDHRSDGPTVNGQRIDETAIVELMLMGDIIQTLRFSSSNDLNTQENNGGYYGAFGTDTSNIRDRARRVDQLVFRSTGLIGDEYSVAGLRGYSVPAVIPLPAAMPLYGTGLAIVSLIGWRKRRKAAAL